MNNEHIPVLLNEVIENLNIKDISVISKENNESIVAITLFNRKVGKNFDLKVKMSKLDDGTWKLKEITNLVDFMVEIDKAEKAKLAELDKPIKEQIYKALKPANKIRGGVKNEGRYFPDWALVAGYTVNNTSDKNIKNSIENLPAQYSNLVYYLNPVRYKYNDGTSNRYHTGFITQEVEQALNVCGISTQDFAALVGFDRGTENETWGLRYSEFIALNTAAIQAQKKEIDELRQQLAEIKEKLQ